MEYFTHPHPLEKFFSESTFSCELCDSVGSGSRIRCSACKFDLHEDCAKYPHHLNDLSHPQHRLSLAKCTGKLDSLFCDGCKEHITVGLLYTCPTCDYDLHTYCTTKAGSSSTSSNSSYRDVLNDQHKKKRRKRVFCLNAVVTVVNLMGGIAGLPLEIPKMKYND